MANELRPLRKTALLEVMGILYDAEVPFEFDGADVIRVCTARSISYEDMIDLLRKTALADIGGTRVLKGLETERWFALHTDEAKVCVEDHGMQLQLEVQLLDENEL